MPVIAVHYTYSGDTALADAHRDEHRAFLRTLHADGTLVLSGPYAVHPQSGSPSALLVLRAESAEAALAVLEQDPFLLRGVIVDRSAREWTVVIGELPEG